MSKKCGARRTGPIAGRRGGRIAVAFSGGLPGAILAAVVLAGGCARSPTVVATTVMVDGTVSPLLLLNTTVAKDGDPTIRASASFVSLTKGDAADRPDAYRFPLELSLSVPVALSGPVEITVEGIDWDTDKVVARGTGRGVVTKEQQTRASVTLTAVSPSAGSGNDAGSADAADGATATAGDAPADL